MSSPKGRLIKRGEIVGKEVYDFDAKRLGTVADIGFGEDAKPVLVITKTDNTEEITPFDRIDRLGDIILLKGDSPQATMATPIPSPSVTASATGNVRICIKCGAANPLTTRFCTQCRNQFF